MASKKMRKTLFLTIIFLAAGFYFADGVKAGAGENVSGWAWSEF